MIQLAIFQNRNIYPQNFPLTWRDMQNFFHPSYILHCYFLPAKILKSSKIILARQISLVKLYYYFMLDLSLSFLVNYSLEQSIEIDKTRGNSRQVISATLNNGVGVLL